LSIKKQAEQIGISRQQYHKRINNWTLTLQDKDGVEYLVSPKHCMVKPEHIKSKDKE
jgi:hypothetical protein